MDTATASNDLIATDDIPQLGYVRHCLPHSWPDGAAGVYNKHLYLGEGRAIWLNYHPTVLKAHAEFRPFWHVLGPSEQRAEWLWLVPPLRSGQVPILTDEWLSVMVGALMIGETVGVYASTQEALRAAVWLISFWCAPAAGTA